MQWYTHSVGSMLTVTMNAHQQNSHQTKTKKYAHPSTLGMVGCKRMCFIILSLSRLLPINSFNGSFELWPAQSWFHRSVNLHYCISNNSLAWLGWDDSSPQPASITVRKKDLEPSQTRPQHPSHTWRDTPGQPSSIPHADEAIATAP